MNRTIRFIFLLILFFNNFSFAQHVKPAAIDPINPSLWNDNWYEIPLKPISSFKINDSMSAMFFEKLQESLCCNCDSMFIPDSTWPMIRVLQKDTLDHSFHYPDGDITKEPMIQYDVLKSTYYIWFERSFWSPDSIKLYVRRSSPSSSWEEFSYQQYFFDELVSIVESIVDKINN